MAPPTMKTRNKKQEKNIQLNEKSNSKINDLIFAKRQLKFQLSSFSQSVKATNPDVGVVEAKYHDSAHLFQGFARIFYELQDLQGGASGEDELAEFEKEYYASIAGARRILFPQLSAYMDKGSTESSPNKTATKLKPPRLPLFGGDYQHWPAFKQMFTTLVHSNTSFPTIVKFHHLRESLRGRAAMVIKNIDFCEENYEPAFKLLTDKFDNRKTILNNYMKKMIECGHPCSCKNRETKSSKDMEMVYNNVNQTLHAVKAMKINTESWDPVIAYVVISNFDTDTMAEWERTASPTEPPTQGEVLTFLEKRVRILESLEKQKGKSKSEPRKYTNNRGEKRKINSTFRFPAVEKKKI